MNQLFAAVQLATNTTPTGIQELVGAAILNLLLYGSGAYCAYRLGRRDANRGLEREAELVRLLQEAHGMLAEKSVWLGRAYIALQTEQQRVVVLETALQTRKNAS